MPSKMQLQLNRMERTLNQVHSAVYGGADDNGVPIEGHENRIKTIERKLHNNKIKNWITEGVRMIIAGAAGMTGHKIGL